MTHLRKLVNTGGGWFYHPYFFYNADKKKYNFFCRIKINLYICII